MTAQTLCVADLCFPVLIWDIDYVSPPLRKPSQLTSGSYHAFLESRRRAQGGKYFLLDSAGRKFRIGDEIQRSGFGFVARTLFGVKSDMRLVDQEKLDLDEFKKNVRKAVMARQRYDKGCYVAVDTKKKLPLAKTYREAIEAVPDIF